MRILFKFVPLFLLLTTSAFAQGGPCPTGVNYLSLDGKSTVSLSTLGVSHCYFASSSSGSDSNTGTSEASPWHSLPGMSSCTSTCATVTPTAGYGLILKGGDTWSASDLIWIYHGSFGNGTAANPVYIGIDLSWFTGGSWTRPILTCAPGACSSGGNYMTVGNTATQYVIVDYLEFTGMHEASVTNYIQFGGTHMRLYRSYAHGWEHTGAVSDAGRAFDSDLGTDSVSRYNICDGSDTTKDAFDCFVGNWYEISYSYVQWVANAQNGSVTKAHDNAFIHIVTDYVGGHQNAWQIATLAGDTNGFIYNNYVSDVQFGGGGHYWWAQNASNAGTTWYVFNNILTASISSNQINICQLGTSCGTHFIFNNTWECGSVANGYSDCTGGPSSPTGTLHFINNHCITTGLCYNATGLSFTVAETTDVLTQTPTQANANTTPHFDQYTESQGNQFSPVSATNSTVSAGANEQSLCNTINALDATAGAACQNSTGYACTYNTTPHTVTCPAQTLTPRPSVAVWDIGAYQFSATPPSSAPAPAMFAGTVTLEGTVRLQ